MSRGKRQRGRLLTGDDPPELRPGDFYINEDGLMVFTREYHLRRGFCCKSGCQHCPWGYRKRRDL